MFLIELSPFHLTYVSAQPWSLFATMKPFCLKEIPKMKNHFGIKDSEANVS
jgi:phosphatidate phosphatase APP1